VYREYRGGLFDNGVRVRRLLGHEEGAAIGVFAAISYAIVILAAVLLPETRGRARVAN
jgi:hypothetical protein